MSSITTNDYKILITAFGAVFIVMHLIGISNPITELYYYSSQSKYNRKYSSRGKLVALRLIFSFIFFGAMLGIFLHILIN